MKNIIKKVIIAVVVIAITLTVGSFIYKLVTQVLPGRQYALAMEMIENGEAASGIKLLSEIGRADAITPEMEAMACENKIESCLNRHDTDAAIELLNSIEMSESLRKTVTDMANEFLNSGYYDDAYKLLELLGNQDSITSSKISRIIEDIDDGDDSDALKLIGEVELTDDVVSAVNAKASIMLGNNEFDRAYSYYEAIGNTEAVTESRINRANDALNSGDINACFNFITEIGEENGGTKLDLLKYNAAGAAVSKKNYETAYLLLRDLDYSDSKELLTDILPKCTDYIFTMAEVGSTVYFGSYYNSDKIEKTALEWIVLDEKDGKLLLITKDIIGIKQFNDGILYQPWEYTTLRTWLNSTFYFSAFTEEQRKYIKQAKSLSMADSGMNITDNVFLISAEEAEKCFYSDSDRTAESTDYAVSLISGFDMGSNYELSDTKWWLSNIDDETRTVCFVDSDGSICTQGADEFNCFGVRPSIWVEYS